MGTRYHIAAKELRGEISAYAKRFDLLEVRMPAADELRLGPSASTMRRWRKSVPPHFEFSVVCGPALGRVKSGKDLDIELASAHEAADVLQARCIVLQTPSDVTPSSLWRERLTKLFDRLRRDPSVIVWEPRGVWEVEDAAAAAERWGVVLGVDPLRDPLPAGPVAYARLRMLGETRAFGVSALERVVAAVGDRRDAYVILETPTALKECKRLRQLAQGARKPKAGGMGRLIRAKRAAEEEE
jgi:uncharacterized protein YecE (DUF72 family)